MDEINVVAESVLKVEIKQEPEFFLKTEPIELEEFISVKSEVKTEEDSEEELEPPAKVFVKSEEVVKEEVAEESEDPLAMCCGNVFDTNAVPQSFQRDPQKNRSGSGFLSQKQKHAGQKRHECSVCQKSFTRKHNLVKHKRIHKPIHMDDTIYTCPVCQKAFTQRRDLVKHMRVYTGEKFFNCPYCQKSFTKYYLVAHMRIHTGDRPYSCAVCQKAFTYKRTLVTHTRIHAGE